MAVTKPYEFIGFGAMEVTKPYEFIEFGAMEVTKPYEWRVRHFFGWIWKPIEPFGTNLAQTLTQDLAIAQTKEAK